MNQNLTDPFNLGEIDDQLINLQIEQIYRMYLPYHQSNYWGMVILDFNLSVIYYIDHGNQSHDPDYVELMDQVELKYNGLIKALLNNVVQSNWEVSSYPLNGSSCEEDLSAILIATVMYFMVQECPVYVPSDQITKLKQKFALWLVEGELPI
jgi:hypothetical protein